MLSGRYLVERREESLPDPSSSLQRAVTGLMERAKELGEDRVRRRLTAFVAEPQPDGVAERFTRTLKEQAIHGRVFKNVE